ncbi:MAG TPA: hypothetical protein VJX73_16750 [Terracidiphilus sp.]|nr:hypothetical protein [Terracidiphilus sp.]
MMALTVLRYTLLLLVIPTYFIALSRRWWTTIPLWLVSTGVMLTQFLMAVQQSAASGTGAVDNSFIYVGEMTKIMLIPMVVQFAIVLRGMGIGAGSRASHGSRKLVEALDAYEL